MHASPIGISDFRKLIAQDESSNNVFLYVDKTSFIQEIIEDKHPEGLML